MKPGLRVDVVGVAEGVVAAPLKSLLLLTSPATLLRVTFFKAYFLFFKEYFLLMSPATLLRVTSFKEYFLLVSPRAPLQVALLERLLMVMRCLHNQSANLNSSMGGKSRITMLMAFTS